MLKNLMKFHVMLLLLWAAIGSSISAQSYTVEGVISGLNQPNAFDFFPNGNIAITEKTGKVKIYSSTGQLVSILWDFGDSSFYYGEMGTLGIALDPNFGSNHNIYVYFVKGDAFNFYFCIVKLTEVNNSGTNPVTIFSFHNGTGSGNTHAAGNMHFKNDGTLLFSVGTIETNCSAQNLNCPRGKILRINTDGTAPVTNPFYDDGNPFTGNDDRIWAYGFRNPYEFCLSPLNDSVYNGENSSGPDEINYVRKGKNYGYPFCTGICGNPMFVDPELQLPGSTVPTGMIIYNGTQFPTLNNRLLFSSYTSDKIFVCELGNAPVFDTIVSYAEWVTTEIPEPNCMKQGPDGFIYLTVLGSGKLVRIKPGTLSTGSETLSSGFSLSQNYPNPFNPITSIRFEIQKAGLVTVRIFNPIGIEVSTLFNGTKQQGIHELKWDASNFPSGVYFYELHAGEFTERKKMVLMK